MTTKVPSPFNPVQGGVRMSDSVMLVRPLRRVRAPAHAVAPIQMLRAKHTCQASRKTARFRTRYAPLKSVRTSPSFRSSGRNSARS